MSRILSKKILDSGFVKTCGELVTRPVNLPPKSYAKREGRKLGRAIDKLNQASKPIYVRSIDDTKQ